MVLSCAVFGCSSQYTDVKKKSFHTFPQIKKTTKEKDKDLITTRLRKWVWAVNRKKVTVDNAANLRICSLHFLTGKPCSLKDQNNPDWIPSQNLGYSEGIAVRIDQKALQRAERVANRARLQDAGRPGLQEQQHQDEIEDVPDQYIDEVANKEARDSNESIADMNFDLDNNKRDIGTQTDYTMAQLTHDLEYLTLLESDNHKLRKRLDILTFTKDSFLNNDSRTRYYTGLDSYKILFLIYEEVASFLYQRNPAIPPFNQLMLTFLKLRFNLPFKYLAERFGISLGSASTYFRRCVHALYNLLKNLIYWPEREELWETMPNCFLEAFGKKVTIIIDCFEVFMERPSNKLAAADCWSQYKHHSTSKTLIGITPQASISLVSESWGGRTTDKHLTAHSGILKFLVPGDLVLADRGFTVAEIIHDAGALLNIPAFTRGKKQLHPHELEETRKIANVRIHVERVIGSVRQKYRILYHGSLPLEMHRTYKDGTSLFDEIVTVCCVLVNHCSSMVE